MALAKLGKTIFSRTISTSLSLSLPVALGAATLFGAACESEPNGDPSDTICVGTLCDGTAPPISGNAIIDCWVTPGDGFDTLDCRYEPPLGYPILLDGAAVRGRSATGDSFEGEIASEQGGRVFSMAHLDPAGYPYELNLDIRFDPSDHSITALEGLDKVTTRVVVGSAAELASDRPASAYIPFALWKVNLLGRDADFSALSFGYELDLGNEASHPIAFKTRPLLFGRMESFYLPVSVNDWSVDAKIFFEDGGSEAATLTGPGDYAVKEGSMVFAEDADYPQELAGGSALASCWFETAGHGFEELYCSAHPGQGLEMEGAMVEVVTTHGDSVRTPASESATLIATISPRAFPMKIAMVGQVEYGIVGLQGLAGRSLRSSMIVDGKTLPRTLSRQTLQAPYSIWDVTVDNQSQGFQGLLDTYVLELGSEGMYDRFAALIDDAQTPFVPDSSSTSFKVATPIGVRSVSGTGFMLEGGQATEIDFELRPGTLVIGAN